MYSGALTQGVRQYASVNRHRLIGLDRFRSATRSPSDGSVIVRTYVRHGRGSLSAFGGGAGRGAGSAGGPRRRRPVPAARARGRVRAATVVGGRRDDLRGGARPALLP